VILKGNFISKNSKWNTGVANNSGDPKNCNEEKQEK